MTKWKTMAAAMCMAWASLAAADPAPFGLELGQSTLDEAKAKYRLQHVGTSRYTDGPIFELDPGQVDFQGLQQVKLIYWPDGKLGGVILTLGKYRFDEVVGMLTEKYRLVSRERPFVGDASAELRDGKTRILVEAPHLSFEMTVLYVTDALFTQFEARQRREEARKKAHEAGQL